MRILSAILLASVGCYRYPDLHHTQKYSIQTHVNADVAVEQSVVDAWIDQRADEWIARKIDWGCEAWSDVELVGMLRDRPVIVYAGWTLPTDRQNSTGNLFGVNFDPDIFGDGARIEITIDFPAVRSFSPYDPDYVKVIDQYYTYGLRGLPHEWTHTARGKWHPEPE